MLKPCRRTAILTGLGIPAFFTQKCLAAKEFWDEKPPKDWTDTERNELLTKSPWAKEAAVHYNAGAGMMTSGARTAQMSRRGGRVSTDSGVTQSPDKYRTIVRWESALPIREANRNISKDDPAANYILGLSGDVPMLGPMAEDESQSEYEHRLEMLKQYTKLEKKGEPIYLTRMGYRAASKKDGDDGVALFYFVRNDLITLEDHTVTFVTKLGPVDVKVKFSTHEMQYRGRVEL